MSRSVFRWLFLTLIFIIVVAIPISADAASISFKNSQIEITPPCPNGEAFEDQVQLTGTSSLETFWICMRGPKNEIASYPVEVTGNSFNYDLHLRFGPGKYTVWAGDNSRRFDGSIRFELESVQEDDNRYLMPSAYVDSDHQEIIRLSESLVKPEMTNFEKITAIHDWVAKNVSYDAAAYRTKDYQLKKASDVLNEKTGICRDYSFLVAALSRASGLPAKVVYGTARDNNNAPQDHAWAEVFVNDKWISVDATWDAGYLQGGTFVFSYTDKYFNPDQTLFAQSHSRNSVTLY